MTDSVGDEAAIAFATGFYDALGAGRSIEDAFSLGRNAIELQGMPGYQIPILKRKRLTASERNRPEACYSPASDVHVDVSVLDERAPSTNTAGTILKYQSSELAGKITIVSNVEYVKRFNNGGPISPLNYISPPFVWDFPVLDIKVLNNGQRTLFFKEVRLEVAESFPSDAPLFTISKDTQQRNAGTLILINEGWVDLHNIMVSFNLVPGECPALPFPEPPFRHSLFATTIEDRFEFDTCDAFQREGVDVDGLIRLSNGEWKGDFYTVGGDAGTEEHLTKGELDSEWARCFGQFDTEVGTLVGEIAFSTAAATHEARTVRFCAAVYLVNKNRLGIPRPPSYTYDTSLSSDQLNYQRRVAVAHTLQSSEADRFTIKVAVEQSSFHRFHAVLVDVSGLEIRTPTIEMECFVPRSSGSRVKAVVARVPPVT